MGYFYFTRHGQTVWNVENKICGATDIELTEKGHHQATELAGRILQEGIHIDEIICSPLMRAADTAKHISEITGVPMRVEPRLKEQNFGKYESTPRNGEEFQRAKTCFADSYEGGESMIRFCQRIYNLLDDIRQEADGTVYLIMNLNDSVTSKVQNIQGVYRTVSQRRSRWEQLLSSSAPDLLPVPPSASRRSPARAVKRLQKYGLYLRFPHQYNACSGTALIAEPFQRRYYIGKIPFNLMIPFELIFIVNAIS